MENYILSGCSVADLTLEHFKKRNIECLFYHFSVDDKEYVDDFGKSLPFDKFYEALKNGAVTKTWQVNSTEFHDYFKQFLEKGLDVVHVTLSSGLSGAYNSALMAAKELENEYPNNKVYVVDSLGASSGYGMILDKMADLRDEGMSAKDLYEWVVEHRLNMHYWFFSTDLKFYIKGGRISKTSGMVGTLLGICPLLNMNAEGKLVPIQKIRTKRKVISEIVKRMEMHADNGLDYSEKCWICHSNCMEDALYLKSLVLEKFKNIKGEIEIFNIGTTIGSHSGPGTVAVFFWGDKRTV